MIPQIGFWPANGFELSSAAKLQHLIFALTAASASAICYPAINKLIITPKNGMKEMHQRISAYNLKASLLICFDEQK
jgi:hypothetical protein